MGTTRLQLYNNALRMCGDRRIATLSDETESRRLLDDVWNDGWIDEVLEAGFWKFAMKSQKFSYETSVTTSFGYQRAFLKPDDWIRPYAICSDEFYRAPLLRYQDDGQYIFADLDDIYVRYVSNGSTRGGDLSLWAGAFADYAAAVGASKIIPKLTADKTRLDMILHSRSGLLAQNLSQALNLDAMGEPQKFPALGSWVNSRGRRGGGPFGDGGATGSLIG